MLSRKLYKYSGAGNDFVVALDDGSVDELRRESVIRALCDRSSGFRAADGRIGADGLMILRAGCLGDEGARERGFEMVGDALAEAALDSRGSALAGGKTPSFDFEMEFYNPDGSGGMMCGNGGRCIVAFADELGLRPASGGVYRFLAADGMHTGEIVARSGSVKTVRLGMIDAFGLRPALDGVFLNTGTRHFVKFVRDVEGVDIGVEGPRYRYDGAFAPEGANANFASLLPDGRLAIRTWEKGVEAETLACGTGITATAIAAWWCGIGDGACADGRAGGALGDGFGSAAVAGAASGAPLRFRLQARTDELQVEFVPSAGSGLGAGLGYAFGRAFSRGLVGSGAPGGLGDGSGLGSEDAAKEDAWVAAREVFLTGPAELI